MPKVKNSIAKKFQLSKAPPRRNWTEDKKIELVALYIRIFNLNEAARQMGIPIHTARNWHYSDWWKKVEDELRTQGLKQTAGKLDGLTTKAMSVVEDRLEKGDFIYDPKSGDIKRIGVKASVANQITRDSIDRKLKLEKLANNSKASDEAVTSRLQALREEFLKFVKSKTIEETPNKEIQ